MRKIVIYCGLLTLVWCSCAGGWTAQTGHLVVAFTDKQSGAPITNATVTVKTLRTLGLNAGAYESHYQRSSARTDTNGIANVEFLFLSPHFEWWVDTPSHHSWHFGISDEFFNCEVQPSDYENIDTNTVDGLAKYNELMNYLQNDNYHEYARKFNPKSVTYSTKTKFRAVSFYPKHKPQSMFSYGGFNAIPLPLVPLMVTNGVRCSGDVAVDVDLGKCALLPPHGTEIEQGEVSDFKLVRHVMVTNGIRSFRGWIEFAPGCGAYKRKKTGDASFPSTYMADTNETYLSRIDFSSDKSMISNKVISATPLLASDEYMIMRTRAVFDSSGNPTNWHYSKILGGVSIGRYFGFASLVFNPRPNDPNLEADQEHNLAGSQGDCRWP